MKSEFSRTWKSSTQPRKQRKYAHKAPLHIKSKFLNTNLSKALRQKHGKRSIRLRTGDKVRILRGTNKGKEGKIDEVNVKQAKVYVSGIEKTKKDGSKIRLPLKPSNLQIVELKIDDKKRKQKLLTKDKEEKKNG